MPDSATLLLVQNLNQHLQSFPHKQCLWVVDENSADGIESCRAAPNLMSLSNRINVTRALTQRGVQSLLTDFNFQAAIKENKTTQIDAVFYRVSKEKAICHHVINQAFEHLPVGGTLFLAGRKQEGIKTYIDKAKALFGSQASISKQKDLYSITLNKIHQVAAQKLDDQQYDELRVTCQDDQFEFYSKPGIFGWNKIDQGSAFLVAHLEEFMHSLNRKDSILDLGCGYGYLTLHASRFKPEKLVATDNSITATTACQHNILHHHIQNAQIITDHCAEQIRDHFDAVLCNPPFHQGFSVEGDLTDRFLRQTHRLLKPFGKALFVVNEFIPLENRATSYFSNTEMMAKNRSFKLVSLTR